MRMALRKPEFSGMTRNPGRNGHDSWATGRNDHSLGTRQDANIPLCDLGGLSRGAHWLRNGFFGSPLGSAELTEHHISLAS
jgi:hypothetical protein